MFSTIRGSLRPALRPALSVAGAAVAGTFMSLVAVTPASAQPVASTPSPVGQVAEPLAAHKAAEGKRRSGRAEKRREHRQERKRNQQPDDPNAVGEQVVKIAAAQAGDPYRYGAVGPDSFDCSGLTSYAYRLGADTTIPRTSSAQRAATASIPASAARRGDLVFFHGSSGVYHVGIFAGDMSIWHAPYSGAAVRKERIWTSSVSYGRVRS